MCLIIFHVSALETQSPLLSTQTKQSLMMTKVLMLASLMVAAKRILLVNDDVIDVSPPLDHAPENDGISPSLTPNNHLESHKPLHEELEDDDPSNPESGGLRVRSIGIVELYSDESYFATPAIITALPSSSQGKYTVMNLYEENTIQVNPQDVHRYQVYEDETRAACLVNDKGGLRSAARETTCVIHSHTTRPSGMVVYDVSFMNEAKDDLQSRTLPFARVRRKNGEAWI